jgi:hypothetical protein
VETGEIENFLEMLAEDVTLVPDSGGQRGAAIRLVKGGAKRSPLLSRAHAVWPLLIYALKCAH